MLLGNVDTAADFSADLYFKCGASGGGISFYRTRVRRQDGVYVTDSAGFLWVFEQVFPDFVSLNQDAMMDTVCYIFVVSVGLALFCSG